MAYVIFSDSLRSIVDENGGEEIQQYENDRNETGEILQEKACTNQHERIFVENIALVWID